MQRSAHLHKHTCCELPKLLPGAGTQAWKHLLVNFANVFWAPSPWGAVRARGLTAPPRVSRESIATRARAHKRGQCSCNLVAAHACAEEA